MTTQQELLDAVWVTRLCSHHAGNQEDHGYSPKMLNSKQAGHPTATARLIRREQGCYFFAWAPGEGFHQRTRTNPLQSGGWFRPTDVEGFEALCAQLGVEIVDPIKED